MLVVEVSFGSALCGAFCGALCGAFCGALCYALCGVFCGALCGAFWFSGGIIVRFKARNGGWSFNLHVLYFVSFVFVFIVIQKKYNGS